jgi:hypothetical protein
MSQHTPQHDIPHPDPTDDTGGSARADRAQSDLVAGDPPVPLTVWRTARTPADTGRRIGARLAARLVAAYSRPGEAVVDLTHHHALAPACAAGNRRHRPAWFTDACSLIVGPASPVPPVRTSTGNGGDAQDDLPELGAWFGNDLTDPDLPPPGGPVTALPEDGSAHGATSLLVACWPLDQGRAAHRVRLAWLLTAGARLLRPGGCLILIVAVTANTTRPEDFSDVVQAAADMGLGYLQHIVAVTADLSDSGHGDAFVYHVTDEELLTLAQTSGQRWAGAHLRVHADMLVFSKIEYQRRVAPRRTGGAGGGRRG